MKLSQIASALKKEFPKSYSSFQIQVNGMFHEIDNTHSSKIELRLYVNDQGGTSVEGSSFKECVRLLKAKLKPMKKVKDFTVKGV